MKRRRDRCGESCGDRDIGVSYVCVRRTSPLPFRAAIGCGSACLRARPVCMGGRLPPPQLMLPGGVNVFIKCVVSKYAE